MTGLKKILALVAATSLAFIGVNAVAPASAAPYEGAHITLVTPTITDDIISEKAKNQAMAQTWIDAGWFGDGLTYTRTWAPVASKILLTYHVTDKDGAPLVGQAVVLRANKQYSTSRAQIIIDGQRAKDATSAADGLKVTHVTDQFGNVSYLVINLDTDGETQPAKWTDAPTISPDGLDDIHAQFLPQIAGEALDHSVITEFHFYNPTVTPPAQVATHPTIRVAAPVLTDTNSIHRADLETDFSVNHTWYAAGIGVRQVYATVGTATNLVYHATDDSGAPLANTDVKLHVGKANSSSTAKVSDITTGTANAPVNLSAAATADQALWTATTDAFGNALFTLKNSDTKGEPIPATPTTAVPATGKVFTQLWPDIAGAADVADMTEFHFVNLPATIPGLKTAAAVSGKAMVGSTLSATKGVWTGTAATYSYQWYRCTSNGAKVGTAAPAAGDKCSLIAGATKATYKLVAADKGKFVRALVTATNNAGAKASLTKSTGKVG